MPGVPQVSMATVRDYFGTLEAKPPDLPMWRGEFYLEGHRGVLTPVWQRLWMTQFHDILTGTSITEVLAHSRPDFASIEEQARTALQDAVTELTPGRR